MDSNDQLICQKKLSKWCGYKRASDIEKFLTRSGIKFFRGMGGVVITTSGLINAVNNSSANDDIDFE